MKAIRVHQTGGPEVLKLEDFELPPPGPGEVRMRNRAVGLNFIEVYQRTGLYQVPMPYTPGGESAGDVIAVGPGVTEFKPGDRVATPMGFGAYAEERNLPAAVLVKLPDTISYETAAAMMLKGLTVQYLLRSTYKVNPGDTILFHAAAGGVGLIACQWARHLGATVIGTVGDREKARLATEAGAHHTILYREEDWVARVAEITGGKKCHVVYDSVGKTTYPGSLDCLRPFGMFVSFGNASGAIDNFNILHLSQKGSLYATRPTLGTHIADRANYLKMCDDLFSVVGSGAVKVPIHTRRPLAEAAEAHRALEARSTTGATVLLP